MNIQIGAIQVAERLLRAPLYRFGDEPGVPVWIELGPCDGKAEFEWHVESGRGRVGSVELYPGEIVNGITTTLNERKNPIQAVDASWNCKGCFGCEAKLREADDIREIKRMKTVVVRNVQEDRVLLYGRSGHVSGKEPVGSYLLEAFTVALA